jgi:hypothetical protein
MSELNERTWGAKWCAAMVKFQAKATALAKSKTVTVKGDRGSYTYDYTPLSQLVEETAPVLSECELAVLQDTETHDGVVTITTTVIHSSGEFREYRPLTFPITARIHDLGSVISYLRRYSFLSALRLAPSDKEDDDGKKVMEAPEKPQWNHKPIGDVTQTLSAQLYASNFKAAFENDDVLKAGAIHKDLHAEGEEAYRNAWALLDSKCRTWVKKAIEASKEVA